MELPWGKGPGVHALQAELGCPLTQLPHNRRRLHCPVPRCWRENSADSGQELRLIRGWSLPAQPLHIRVHTVQAVTSLSITCVLSLPSISTQKPNLLCQGDRLGDRTPPFPERCRPPVPQSGQRRTSQTPLLLSSPQTLRPFPTERDEPALKSHKLTLTFQTSLPPGQHLHQLY